MAAKSVPVSAPGLASPRSPTLSDFGMILPDDPLRSYSPSPYIERPPSPPSLLYSHANRSAHTIKQGSAPQHWRRPSLSVTSPPLSAQSSRSTLRTMGDSAVAPKTPGTNNDHLASSPTIQDALSSHVPNGWSSGQQSRRLSSTSSSVHSEDLENIKWPAFAESGGFDDSGVVLEDDDDEDTDQFPVDVRAVNDAGKDPWMDGQSDSEEDNGEYSSAALSKRAEIILANAKKRLNVMEGNLRGARQSLVVSPSFNHTPKSAPELPTPLSALRDRDRRLYAGMGPIAPRIRPFYSSPLSTNNTSPGHSRVLSETAARVTSPTHLRPNKRAMSALGTTSGPWSPEGYGQGRFPIRESRSFEVVREPKESEDRDPSLHVRSKGSKSPPNTLETLPEDDSPKLHRSASAASDLRGQMMDLKGRISSLKQRAEEDNLRRRSLQSLRTPTPFTSAETWYAEAEAYKNGTSPVAADGGVGFKTESPTRKALYEGTEADFPAPQVVAVGISPERMQAPQESPHAAQPLESPLSPDYPTSHYDDAQSTQFDDSEAGVDIPIEADVDETDETDETEENDFLSSYGDEYEAAGDSVYEDAVYEMPIAERHEDRVDAFDYENFFLHSAMGTYSSGSRRSSSSSADSVATTRPVVTVDDTVKRASYHQRNSSMDSVSTMASFATAAEEQSDDEEENEEMDQFSQQILPNQQPIAQRLAALSGHVSPRNDSAVNMGKAYGSPTIVSPTYNPHISYRVSPTQASMTSRNSSGGSSPTTPGGLASGLQTSKIFSILTESHAQDEPRLALNEEEKQLIYSLAASFQQVCSHLQSTSGDQYERKEWRRRLDEARRLLNGENLEGQLF